METEQESVSVNQQNGVSEESAPKNDDSQCSDAVLTVCNDKEDELPLLNMTEANVDDTLNSDVVLSSEVNAPMQTSESSLTDEHSYANVNNESLSADQSSTIVENDDASDEAIHMESVLPLDTLNNVISNGNEQIDNYPNDGDNDTVPLISSEVVITEEVITIDSNDIHKTCTKNKDSSNGNDAPKAMDLFYIGNFF